MCCEVVEEYYGDFFRAIFQCLCQDGRLKATQIAQRCRLPLRQVQTGLASLIQLRLVNHHSTAEFSTTYSPNLHNAYNIIRFGKLIEVALLRRGQIAADIVETLCQLGFATISEVTDRLVSPSSALETRNAQLVECYINELLQDGLLIHLRSAHLKESYDAQQDVESDTTTLATLAKLSGTKAKQEHLARVMAEYRKLISTDEKESGYVNETSRSEGKQDTNGMSKTGSHEVYDDPSTLIQINPHKLVSIAQGERILEMAPKHYDDVTRCTLQCLIEQATCSNLWSNHLQLENPVIDAQSLTDDVNNRRHAKNITTRSHRPIMNGHAENKRTEDVKVGEVQRCITALTDSRFRMFLHSDTLDSKWYINRKELESFLQREETLQIMTSRLEDPAPRVLRILVEKGKLEEKTVQEIGLLGAKELRQCLSMLKRVGYLDLQEVPRNQQRQPNHTVFLWFYDNKRTSTLVLESVYAAIERLIHFLKIERQNIASTIIKYGGKDAGSTAQQDGNGLEYTLFLRYRRLEDWVWAEINRLDTTVAILRDN